MARVIDVIHGDNAKINLWETYRDRVMEQYGLTKEEANKWADEFMNYNFSCLDKK